MRHFSFQITVFVIYRIICKYTSFRQAEYVPQKRCLLFQEPNFSMQTAAAEIAPTLTGTFTFCTMWGKQFVFSQSAQPADIHIKLMETS